MKTACTQHVLSYTYTHSFQTLMNVCWQMDSVIIIVIIPLVHITVLVRWDTYYWKIIEDVQVSIDFYTMK